MHVRLEIPKVEAAVRATECFPALQIHPVRIDSGRNTPKAPIVLGTLTLPWHSRTKIMSGLRWAKRFSH